MGPDLLTEWSSLPTSESGAVLFMAMQEMVLIVAQKKVLGFRLDMREGFDIPEMEAGTAHWVPLYVAFYLHHLRVVRVQLPSWLTKRVLDNLLSSQKATGDSELVELPKKHFFEVSQVFFSLQCFDDPIVPPEELQGERLRTYFSRAQGVVAELWKLRRTKILRRLAEVSDTQQPWFTVPNAQMSETPLIDTFLKEWIKRFLPEGTESDKRNDSEAPRTSMRNTNPILPSEW